MNYFKNNNNEIFAYDDIQVEQGFGKDLVPLQSGEFYDGVTTQTKPYRLNDSYIAVEKNELGEIISPAGLVTRIQADKELVRITNIKAKAQELILETYPLYKQNNILMSGIQVDIDTMNSFISNTRSISNAAEANFAEPLNIVW